jgi:molybdate transport repressor ModE-like protein
LAAAAREVGYSYRHVWNLLGEWNHRMGQPLVELERGRGASLTPLAAKLLDLDGRARLHLAPQLAELVEEFENELRAGASTPRLSIHASHDLALEQLPWTFAFAAASKISKRWRKGTVISRDSMSPSSGGLRKSCGCSNPALTPWSALRCGIRD